MLFQKECLATCVYVFVCALLFGAGCKRNERASPEGYQFDKPQVIPLGKALNEISGICFNRENGSLLAISDSKQHVFELDLKKTKLKDYTGDVVPPDSDVEDIAKVETTNTLYLLESKGAIVEVPDKAKDTTGVKTYPLNLGGSNNFETLYHDPSRNELVMLCKTCENEASTGEKKAYRFNLRTKTFDSTAAFTISLDNLRVMIHNSFAKFNPSAAAIHPFDKRLYILSSVGSLLVVADTSGEIIEAYELDKDLFPKAEGIAFANNGDMFISNEAKFGRATLLRFVYQPSEKKK